MARAQGTASDEQSPSGGVWALPLLGLGLGLVACCYLIPAAQDTRSVLYERERLEASLEGLRRQVALNAEFLERIHTDHELALRLAARQRTLHEPDVGILAPSRFSASGGLGSCSMSPFALVALEPSPPDRGAPPAIGGRLAMLCRDSRGKLIVLGAGLLACMLGLLGGASRRRA